MNLYESIKEKQSLLDIQKYIFNKYRDEFDLINEVYDLTDYINRLFSEGGMQKVDEEFFLPSATPEYKKDFKKLITKI